MQLYKEIKRTITSFRIRDIDNCKYKTSKYCKIDFYINKIFENKASIIAYFKPKIYIVDNLQVKILIDTNVFRFEVIVVNIAWKKLVIDSCNTIVSLSIILKKKRIERKLYSQKQVIVSLYIVIIISIKYCEKAIFNNCNYSFLSRFNIALEFSSNFFAYMVNANIEAI